MIKEKIASPAEASQQDSSTQAVSKIDNAKFNKVVDAAELVSITLKDVRFKFDSAFFNAKKKSDRQYTIDRSTKEIVVDDEHGSARGDFAWSVDVKVGKKRVFHVNAVYSVLYNGLNGQSEYEIRIFLLRTARVASYSYFRALVAHLASDAGAEIPPLPAFKMKAATSMPKTPE